MDKLEDQPDQSGGCLCGKVRYELKGPRYYGVLCHCVTCRRVTGGSFLAASIYPIDVRLPGLPVSSRACGSFGNGQRWPV